VNEKQIKALIKEAEAAAKRYKAELNAKSKSPAPKTTKAPAKPKTKAPKVRGGSGMRGGLGSLGSGGGMRGSVNK
jgi:hypothetical protein